MLGRLSKLISPKSCCFIVLFHLILVSSSHSQNTTYPKVQNFPFNNVSYPSVFQSRSSAGNTGLNTESDGTNLKINGESYNIRTSSISNNKETHFSSRRDVLSPRDSYAPNGSGGDGSPNPDLFDVEPTEAPVIGAIDYVLLPLLILGVAGPIFVVMYIVMGVIEFKLPPNVQQRSLEHRKNSYIEMTSVFQTVRPALNMLYEAANRAIEQGECKERIACEMGQYAKGYRGWFLYDSFERVLRAFTPKEYTEPLKAYIGSVRNDEACAKFTCFK